MSDDEFGDFVTLTWKPCQHSRVVYRKDADVNLTCPVCGKEAEWAAVEPAPAPGPEARGDE